MKLLAKFVCTTCLILSLSPFHTLAQDTGTEPIDEVKEFKAYMIDHPFEGCPAGSKCTKETGDIRQGWINLLKSKSARLKKLESYRQSSGLPLATWSYPVTNVTRGLALWNSPCANHNIEAKRIYLAEVMASNFKSLAAQKNIIVRQMLMQDKDKYIVYPMLRDDAPLYIKNSRMHYHLDIDGQYYGISVTKDGSVNVIDPLKPTHFPENIQCTDDMIKAFEKLPTPEDFYKGTSCKTVWDEDAKRFRTIVFGWSCG